MAGRAPRLSSVIFTCLFSMVEQNRTPVESITRICDPKSSVPVHVATT